MEVFDNCRNMEDLGFFPYPSSFSTGFHDEILDPGPTSFFLKDPLGEDVLLAQGLDNLQSKLGFSLFEEENGSPVNVDDDDWLMRDLSDDIQDPIDIPFTLDDLKAEGYVLIDGVLQDPNNIIEPMESAWLPQTKKSSFSSGNDVGHKCLVCNIALFRLKEVIGHILTLHCSKGDYMCTLCNTELYTIGSVKKHIKNVHFGFRPFQCPACKKSIQQKSHLKTHIEKQHGNKKGLLKKALLSHNKFTSKEGSKKTFDSSASVVKTGENKDELTCPLCSKVYLSLETKERHLQTFHKQKAPMMSTISSLSHPNEQPAKIIERRKSSTSELVGANLDCPICQKTLESLELKKAHVKNVHQNLRTFECKKCNNVIFYSQLHYKAHQRLKHPAGRELSLSGSLQCEYHNCKVPVKSLRDLLRHVEEFHAYQCPECPRHLQTTSGLDKHYKKAHISNELLCCSQCGNCYKDEDELNQHMADKHDNDDSSVDSNTECNKSLLVEKIMHTDVLESIKRSVYSLARKLAAEHQKKVPCEYCRANEKFDSADEVLEHIKSMHPIQCPDCPLKMFKYPTSVRKHFKKFHGSDTPYFCKTCTLVFKSADAVQNHMENEHGIANIVVVNNVTLSSPQSVQQSPPPTPPQTQFTTSISSSITCIVCGQVGFESGNALAEHRSENHFYKCLDCDKEYKLTDSLRKHVKVTHNENVTMTCCKFCDKVLMDTSQKSNHLATMHKDLTSPKDKISESVVEIVNVESSSLASFQCPKCVKSFNSSDTLAKHAKFFHNIAVKFCHECHLTFADEASKGAHWAQKHLKDSTKSLLKLKSSPEKIQLLENKEQEFACYKCPKCPKTYNIGKSLRKHCRKNHNKLSICFCQHCPKVFVNVSQRDSHVDKEHPSQRPATKEPSSPPLSKVTSPMKTTISVSLPSSPPTQASTVQASSTSPRIIVVKSPSTKSPVTTILKKVEVIQPQKCPHCHEFISNLKHHVCELPWKCPVLGCGKRYKLNSGLRKHCREGHGLGQVAVCESCQITFMDGISGLEEHNREKHSASSAATVQTSPVPSSPESFHGFVTPTKELDMAKRFETIILNLSDI